MYAALLCTQHHVTLGKKIENTKSISHAKVNTSSNVSCIGGVNSAAHQFLLTCCPREAVSRMYEGFSALTFRLLYTDRSVA